MNMELDFVKEMFDSIAPNMIFVIVFVVFGRICYGAGRW
jgi:hypothetical protein